MAYALRYYKEFTHADGTVIRLEIYKKDSTASAVEIGAVVQRLSLEIQGQQDDIDSPIQKTSLHMTFVDASDIENGQKNGFWQEFYTPDALMWKVILKAKDAKETEFRTIWGGYVTPDSFSEDLVYRGSVSITARDNIGHMQDFPFDAEGDADGMISLYNLVESGWEKIQSPMMLEWRGAAESTMWLMCDGVSAMFTLMNVSMFEGMDWYKAIETALASYGVVMRYVGNNIVKMSSLRSMPYQGEEFIEDITHIEPRFITGAQRELVPAVKRIEESVDYKMDDMVFEKLPQSSFTGDIERFEVAGVTYEKSGIAWTIDKKESGSGWCCPRNSMFFNAEQYPFFQDEDGDARYNFLVCNTYGLEGSVGYRYAEYSRPYYFPATLTFDLRLGQPYILNTNGNLMPYYQLENVSVAVIVEYSGATYYLQKDDSWDTVAVSHVLASDNLSLQIPAADFTGRGMMKIQIHHIKTSSNSKGIGQYIPLYSATLTHSASLREKNTVNTNYDASNNVILSRDPEIGPAFDKVALPRFIKNGIFYRSGDAILPAKKWSWGSGSEQQMAVWNHLQLLSYYAKPNNLISGTIVNADITRAKAIYMWHGAEHILVSGTYNFLNGHIESAVLREFARYEDMWSEVAGADMPDTEQDSRSNVEGGASGGGASSTYTNTTTVNIGSGGGGGTGASYLNDLLDVDTTGVVAQSVLYYNGTSWVDMSLPTLLNPYLKADVAAQTYAKSSDLSALTTRVVTNEGSIASLQSGKADKATTLAGYGIKDAYTTTQIDAKVQTINNALALRYTKTEVDAIVETINDALDDRYTKKQTDNAISTALASYYTKNEIDGKVTTINNALADRYTKTQVDGIVTTINQSITSVDNKYAPTKTWADTLASLIVNENGNIRIKTNLIVNGDTSSGGGSGETAIGITGILLNGTTYRDENSDGIIDLGTITSGLTSVNWSDVQGRPTSLSQFNNDLGLGTLAYKNGLTASDVGALSTSGGTISGNYAGAQLKIESTYGNGDSYIEFQGGSAYVGYSAGGFAFLQYGGDYIAIKSDGAYYKSNKILTSEGGTISGRFTIGDYLQFSRLGDGKTYLLGQPYGVDDPALSFYDGASWRKIYHTGNLDPSIYLRKDVGGDINGNVMLRGGSLGFYKANGQFRGYLGATGDDTSNNIFWYNNSTWNTLLHSGNIEDYKAGGLTYVDGKKAIDLNTLSFTDGGVRFYFCLSNQSANSPSGIRGWESSLLAIPLHDVGTTAQLYVTANNSNPLYFRSKSDGDWKTIAFTDSTVAGAYKLVTSAGADAVTIDANKSVTFANHLYLADNKKIMWLNSDASEARIALDVDGSNNLRLGYGTRPAGFSTTIYGHTTKFVVGDSSIVAAILNSSGNVTIGGSDLAGTAYQLYVNDKVGAALYYFAKNKANCGYIGLASSSNNDITISTDSTSKLWLNGNGNTIMNYFGGNVLIGTTTDNGNGAKLQVNGGISVRAGAYIYEYKGVRFYANNGTNAYIGGNTIGQVGIYAKDAIFLRPNQPDFESPTSYGVKITQSETEIIGDLRVKGNLIVTGDSASGGSAGTTTGVEIIPFVEINLYSILMMIQQSSDGKITQTQMDSAGLTEEVITQLMEGRVNQIKNTYSNGSSCSYSIENNGGQILLTIMSGTGGFNKYQKLISTGMWSKIS